MTETVPYTVVIGCGRRLAGDDAAGLHIVEALLSDPSIAGCEFRVYEGGWPQGFLAEIPIEHIVLFIASVQDHTAPGTICCVKLPAKSVHSEHLHSTGSPPLGLDEELQEARKARGAVPRTFLVGIESAGYRGTGLSERVQTAVDEIVRNFQRYLKLARDLA